MDVLLAERQEKLLHRYNVSSYNVSTFSRRSFVKGGGALIVGFSLAGRASAAVSPFASDGPSDLGAG